MPDPIGITFMPSADNAALGPEQGGLNGPGQDLSQAFKILSLRLPRVLGAGAISAPRLLNSPGAAGVSGLNPHAAVFEALLRALVGGGAPSGFGGPDAPFAASPPGYPPGPGPSAPPLARPPGEPPTRIPTSSGGDPSRDRYQPPPSGGPRIRTGDPSVTFGRGASDLDTPVSPYAAPLPDYTPQSFEGFGGGGGADRVDRPTRRGFL